MAHFMPSLRRLTPSPSVRPRALTAAAALWMAGCVAGLAGAQAPPAPPAPAGSPTTPPADSAPPLPRPLRCPASSGSFEALARPLQATVPASPATPDAPIDISSDNARLGVDGNAQLSGNVRVTQGDRRLEADDVEYDAKAMSFTVRGSVRYEDPRVARPRRQWPLFAVGRRELRGCASSSCRSGRRAARRSRWS